MTVISITTGKPLDPQPEYAQMEQSFADDKTRLAYDLFMGRMGEMEYRRNSLVGVDLTDQHCFLCGGSFAKTGMVYGFWKAGKEFVYLHRGCRNEAEEWSR